MHGSPRHLLQSRAKPQPSPRSIPQKSRHGSFRPVMPIQTVTPRPDEEGGPGTAGRGDVPYRLPRLLSEPDKLATPDDDPYKVWSRHGYDVYSPKPVDLIVVSSQPASPTRVMTGDTKRSAPTPSSSFPKFRQAMITPTRTQPKFYAGNISDPAFYKKSISLENLADIKSPRRGKGKGRKVPLTSRSQVGPQIEPLSPRNHLPPIVGPPSFPSKWYGNRYASSVVSEPVNIAQGAFLHQSRETVTRAEMNNINNGGSSTHLPDLHLDPSPTPIPGQYIPGRYPRTASPAKSTRSIHWTLSPVRNNMFDKKGGSRAQGPYSREFTRKCTAPNNWMKMKWGRSKTTMV